MAAILLANYIFFSFSPEDKHNNLQRKHCSACVCNTEHVGGFRGLIHVHTNQEQRLLFFAHERPLGQVSRA